MQKGKATHVDITAYRASSLLSNGKTLIEREDIGRRRAEQMASLLKDAGLATPGVSGALAGRACCPTA